MGWAAARKLRRAVDGLARVLAVELLTAARALELRAPLRPGRRDRRRAGRRPGPGGAGARARPSPRARDRGARRTPSAPASLVDAAEPPARALTVTRASLTTHRADRGH